jgi:hypothetical protein
MKKNQHIIFLRFGTAMLILSLLTVLIPSSVFAVQPIFFPVIGKASFSNDFNAPRSNGPHHAIDIIAAKGQKIVAAMSGVVTFVAYPEPSWGNAVFIKGDDGFTYNYLHINNDTPGTDDGQGGPMNAYAPDIRKGNRVVKGQMLGWVGDSGNAENTVSHLHFEMVASNGTVVNPYLSLVNAKHLAGPAEYPSLPDELRPYGQNATIRANVALGNVDTDPEEEIITGSGPGTITPQIQIYNFDRTYVGGFNAYTTANYMSGADVATADVDGDGVDEIVTGAGTTSQPLVKVFKADGTLVASFLAYDASSTSGLSVAAGDIDNDGKDEIITGQRIGASPVVKAFKIPAAGLPLQVASFNAYLPSFTGGIDVASADVTGDNKAEIITGPISSASPDVRIYDASGTQLGQFYAFDTSYRSGIRVSAGNVRTNTTKAEIQVVPVASTSHLRTFNAAGTVLEDHWFIEEWWRTTFDVASGQGISIGTAGVNRRTTVRLMTY